jgi:SAM-dependent methyltransferase
MRLKVVPENWIERIALWLGLVPLPLVDTQFAYLLARTIMTAQDIGLFEALRDGPLDADEAAARCKVHPRALRQLLHTLVGAGYLRLRAGRFSLTPKVRKWLLRGTPQSLYDKMRFQFVEYDLIRHYSDYVRTGESVAIHQTFTPDDWDRYMRAMRDLARLNGAEVGWRTPVPRSARNLLDIGGSHGHFAAQLCRRHPGLRAEILELPAAIAASAPILAEEGMGDRVVHRAGDALSDDLGEAAWDVILISQLVHHFSEAENQALVGRAARALRPGGVLVVQEVIRPGDPGGAGTVGSLLDLYFAATSASGTWPVAAISSWMQAAGLTVKRPIWLQTLPGAAQVWSVKP